MLSSTGPLGKNCKTFPHVPATPSELFLQFLGRLGTITFSKSPSSAMLAVMLQVLVLVPCFPGLYKGGVVNE